MTGIQLHSRLVRWALPSDLLADKFESLEDQLTPVLQRILNGTYEPCGDDPSEVRLNRDAELAVAEVNEIINQIDPTWRADIRSPDAYFDAPPDGLSADSSDEDVTEMAKKAKQDAAAENIAFDGCVEDFLKDLREELRRAKNGSH